MKYLGRAAGNVMTGIGVVFNLAIYTSSATFLKYLCRNILKVLISKYTDYVGVE